jgi:hypothetical protein
MRESRSVMAKEEKHRRGVVGGLLDAFVPLSMYHVKHLAKPKGGNIDTIRILTLFGLLIGLATFISLFITQSQSYTVETTVQTSDLSNSGYTCSMAAVISETVTLNDTTDPIEFYDLIKINELGNQCFTSLNDNLPCESSIVYQLGAHSLDYGFELNSLSAYSTGILYFVGTNGDTDNAAPYKYNVESGSIEMGVGSYVSMSDHVNSASVGGFIVNGFFGGDTIEFMPWSEFEADTNFVICYKPSLTNPVGCTQVLLTNDNFFASYLLVTETTTKWNIKQLHLGRRPGF